MSYNDDGHFDNGWDADDDPGNLSYDNYNQFGERDPFGEYNERGQYQKYDNHPEGYKQHAIASIVAVVAFCIIFVLILFFGNH